MNFLRTRVRNKFTRTSGQGRNEDAGQAVVGGGCDDRGIARRHGELDHVVADRHDLASSHTTTPSAVAWTVEPTVMLRASGSAIPTMTVPGSASAGRTSGRCHIGIDDDLPRGDALAGDSVAGRFGHCARRDERGGHVGGGRPHRLTGRDVARRHPHLAGGAPGATFGVEPRDVAVGRDGGRDGQPDAHGPVDPWMDGEGSPRPHDDVHGGLPG